MSTTDSRLLFHAQIADCLPGNWMPQRNSITRADELRLDIIRRGSRLHIKPPALYTTLRSGRHTWYGNAPAITVSVNRTPESIARDIARRLLPDAEKWHAEAIAWRDQIQAADAAHHAALARFDEIGGLWRSDNSTNFHGHHLIARVDSGESATLEFRGIDPDIALALVVAYEDARRRAST